MKNKKEIRRQIMNLSVYLEDHTRDMEEPLDIKGMILKLNQIALMLEEQEDN